MSELDLKKLQVLNELDELLQVTPKQKDQSIQTDDEFLYNYVWNSKHQQV